MSAIDRLSSLFGSVPSTMLEQDIDRMLAD